MSIFNGNNVSFDVEIICTVAPVVSMAVVMVFFGCLFFFIYFTMLRIILFLLFLVIHRMCGNLEVMYVSTLVLRFAFVDVRLQKPMGFLDKHRHL